MNRLKQLHLVAKQGLKISFARLELKALQRGKRGLIVLLTYPECELSLVLLSGHFILYPLWDIRDHMRED